VHDILLVARSIAKDAVSGDTISQSWQAILDAKYDKGP